MELRCAGASLEAKRFRRLRNRCVFASLSEASVLTHLLPAVVIMETAVLGRPAQITFINPGTADKEVFLVTSAPDKFLS